MHYAHISSEVEEVRPTYDSEDIALDLAKKITADRQVVLQCSFGEGRLTNTRSFKSSMYADPVICYLFENMEVKEVWVAINKDQKDEMDSIFISLLHTRHHEYKKMRVGSITIHRIKFK